jgi:hypothetical protein
MSGDFVSFRPDIETLDPDIAALTAEIVEFWEAKGRNSPKTEGTGQAVRGAHAKTFGVAKAEVEILDGVPAAYAQGIYAEPGQHGALIRFSSANNHLGPDAQLGAAQGFAIKIFDIDGPKLVEDEPDCTTFDLVLKNNPVFIANTARHYLVMQDIADRALEYLARGRKGFDELLTDLLTGGGTFAQEDWSWGEVLAFVRLAAQTPVTNPLLTTFWTMGAVRHGAYVAKVRVAPVTGNARQAIHHELDLTAGSDDVFATTLADELRAAAFEFDLQVQLCADLEAMPVDDTTVEWPEKLSPFVTVGRVRLPRQDITGNFEAGDALAFNQWRVTEPHRPLGEIMQVRRIYTASAKVRRTINNQPLIEPASADEVLPLPELEVGRLRAGAGAA